MRVWPLIRPAGDLHAALLRRSGHGHARRATPDFDIVINFVGVVPAAYQAAFAAAEQTWELLLPGLLAGIAPIQLKIDASFPAIDGAGKILGQVPRALLFFFRHFC